MAPVLSGCEPPPVLEAAEHKIAAFVVLDGVPALLSARDAPTYPIVIKIVSKLVGVISAGPKQPVDLRLATEQRTRVDVIADLFCHDKQVQGALFAVANGVELRVDPAFGAADQAPLPPLSVERFHRL